MSHSSDPIDRAPRVTPVTPVEGRRRERAPVEDASAGTPVPEADAFDGVPGAPPDEVLAEVDAAMAHLERLRAAGASVSFRTGPEGLRIDLEQDGERRPIGPAELFDIASGRTDPSTVEPSTPPADGTTPRVDREA